ncbi:hypothetical protein ACFVQ4_16650 [Streptomyces laurentii]|uniref:hypothetical protein n=1 Tax=Streptomyces laurentii TaxID=39478 RepID=UPI0036BC1DF9
MPLTAGGAHDGITRAPAGFAAALVGVALLGGDRLVVSDEADKSLAAPRSPSSRPGGQTGSELVGRR